MTGTLAISVDPGEMLYKVAFDQGIWFLAWIKFRFYALQESHNKGAGQTACTHVDTKVLIKYITCYYGKIEGCRLDEETLIDTSNMPAILSYQGLRLSYDETFAGEDACPRGAAYVSRRKSCKLDLWDKFRGLHILNPSIIIVTSILNLALSVN